jgi:hypothetical protein
LLPLGKHTQPPQNSNEILQLTHHAQEPSIGALKGIVAALNAAPR